MALRVVFDAERRTAEVTASVLWCAPAEGTDDHELGLENARRAAELEPEYPPNQLALAEALTTNGDRGQGLAVYKKALAQARQLALEGDPDAPEWVSDAEQAIADLS